jgi:hypothetical protein
MLGLFGQNSSKSKGNTSTNIFDEEDIRQLLQTFSITPTQESSNQLVFLANSKSSLVKGDGILKALKSWSDKGEFT